MEVVEVPLDKIKVKDRARADMGEKEMRELEESIREYGLIQPISIDTNYNLLAGERRLRAHRSLGLTTISCVVRPDAKKVAKLELELDENIRRKDLTWPERARLEKRIWDLRVETDPSWAVRDQQKVHGASLGTISMRLQLAEALETMPDLEKYDTQEEAFKELKRWEETETRFMMDLKKTEEQTEAPKWADEHYVIGDAINGMAGLVKAQLHQRGQAFHFAEVDPPYGVDLHRRKGRNANDSSMEEYLEWEDFPKLFETTARLVYECLAPNAFGVFWYGMSRHQEVLDILRRVGWAVSDIPAIWHKGEVGQTASPDTQFGSCYEPFFIARKGQPKLARPGRSNVFTYAGLQRKSHPTEKPIWLLEEILKSFCFPGSRILVPFLGSGVTLRAAYKLEHTGLGFDLSDKHKAGFLKRVQEDMDALEAANLEAVQHADAG
jgi:ParB family chromosome partitioning protein